MPAGTPLQVLIVDDEENDAFFVVRELQRGGYAPQWIRVDTEPALREALGSRAWDLITCDWVMPCLSAEQAIAIIRDSDADVPLIIVSGQVGEEVTVTALRAGADDYVSKHNMTRLVPAVGRELREAASRRERRHVARLLRDSQRRYALATATGRVGVWDWDIRSRLFFIDSRFKRALGFEDEELPNEIDAWVARIHPDDIPRIGDAMQEHLDGKKEAYELEHRLLHRDGSFRWVLSRGSVLLDEAGKPYRIIGSMADITDRVVAEANLQRLNRELEQRIQERTAELETTIEELNAFSYSVSHDLRAPLRAIDGFSKAILEECESGLGEQGLDYLARVRRAAQQMGELIDDLLVLHRVARAELRREPVHLSAIAHEIAANLRREQPEREVSFRVADDLMTSGDVTLLRAALTNLMGNAWKFTAKKDGACIEFGRLSGESGDTFFVRDDGVGFDMTQSHRLFMPFQHLHERSEFDGTGIGLATVRRIVTKHGGRIWAEAAPGQGACFYFTLEPSQP